MSQYHWVTTRQTFVCNLDKETESLSRLEFQSFCNILTEVFRSCTGFNFKCIMSVIREKHLVKNLRRSVVNSIDLNLVWRVFSCPIPVTDIKLFIDIFIKRIIITALKFLQQCMMQQNIYFVLTFTPTKQKNILQSTPVLTVTIGFPQSLPDENL